MPTELLPEWDYDEENPAFDELIRKGWDAYLKDEYALAGELFETLLRDAESAEATAYIAHGAVGLGQVLACQGAKIGSEHAVFLNAQWFWPAI